uniref:Uncharacterized protein n=1 Tax=Tanacetum cinerariifolium TaxID=118510 RepID=A0A699H1J7_TANCI|nr:hypothetical protein [Tanacetum cinerariifolium]
MYHKKNVDFAYLLWEYFVYQVEQKDAKKSNEMYYPSSVILPIELTNEDIRNSAAYKEYYAVASGAAPPKTKASVRKTQSSFDTTITPPMAAGTRLLTSAKGKQPAKSSKAKGLFVLFEVSMTEAKQIELATKRSLQQTHISQASGSGADEGTGILLGVLNVPTDESDEEISWKSSDKDDDDEVDDKSNVDASLGMNVGGKKGQDAEDDDEELYRDVNIYLEGRDKQMTDVHTTKEFEDTHVTLTLVNPDSQQQSLSVSSQFVTSMLNPSLFSEAVSSIPRIVKRHMDQRMNEAVKIIKEQVKEQVKVQVSKILPNIKKTVNEQLKAEFLTRSSNSSKTSYVVAAELSELKLKKILIEKMKSNKSIYRSDQQRNLYKALVDAYECNKIILDTYGDSITFKRHHDDADNNEEPSAGSDRGSKRRREGKEPESTSAPTEKATKTTSKSTEGSKSHQKTASESAPAEEPMQKTYDLEEPSHQEFETGAADDQTIIETSQHLECDLAKQADSCSSFNELMDAPVDFSAFLMNRLKVDTLTLELLAGPAYELMKGSCKSLVELEFFLEEEISHWGRKRQQFYRFTVNRESARDVYSKRRIIAVTEPQIVKWHNYKHLDWITVCRDDDKLYKFKEGNFKRLCIQDVEDMLLLLNNDKQNRLMRIDELHKFSDGTINDVRTTLDDHLKGIRMKYLPQAIRRRSNKERAAAMIQAIDKQLKTRRIMRSLEKFVGGRLYEGDFRMLQRTI